MSEQKLTNRQAAIIGCYTGILCGPFRDVHALAEELLGKPVLTHQFANEQLRKDLKEAAKPLFMEIVVGEDEPIEDSPTCNCMGRGDESPRLWFCPVHGKTGMTSTMRIIQQKAHKEFLPEGELWDTAYEFLQELEDDATAEGEIYYCEGYFNRDLKKFWDME